MNRTTHYNLVLFESTDKPTWLENWNSTMSHIDEVLYRISSGGGDLPDLSEVVARLEVLESQMSSANLQIQQNANNITAMQGSIDTINTTLVGLAETDSALQGNITSLQDSVSNIQTSLGTISDQLTNVQSSVTGLDTRVTALENNTGGDIEAYIPVKVFPVYNRNQQAKTINFNGVIDDTREDRFNHGDILFIYNYNPSATVFTPVSDNLQSMSGVFDDKFTYCQFKNNALSSAYKIVETTNNNVSINITLSAQQADYTSITVFRKLKIKNKIQDESKRTDTSNPTAFTFNNVNAIKNRGTKCAVKQATSAANTFSSSSNYPVRCVTTGTQALNVYSMGYNEILFGNIIMVDQLAISLESQPEEIHDLSEVNYYGSSYYNIYNLTLG